MSGRPSGRCAATEALEPLLRLILVNMEAATYRDLAADGPVGNEEGEVWAAIVAEAEQARAALASPCCVSADQEQVKEALRRIVGESYNLLTQGESPTQRRGPSAQRIYDEARAALALLGSNEEEEQ